MVQSQRNVARENAIRVSERQRISRELHDSTAQLLEALQQQLGRLRAAGIKSCDPIMAELAGIIEEIRKSIAHLGDARESPEPFVLNGREEIAKRFYSVGSVESHACEIPTSDSQR